MGLFVAQRFRDAGQSEEVVSFDRDNLIVERSGMSKKLTLSSISKLQVDKHSDVELSDQTGTVLFVLSSKLSKLGATVDAILDRVDLPLGPLPLVIRQDRSVARVGVLLSTGAIAIGVMVAVLGAHVSGLIMIAIGSIVLVGTLRDAARNAVEVKEGQLTVNRSGKASVIQLSGLISTHVVGLEPELPRLRSGGALLHFGNGEVLVECPAGADPLKLVVAIRAASRVSAG